MDWFYRLFRTSSDSLVLSRDSLSGSLDPAEDSGGVRYLKNTDPMCVFRLVIDRFDYDLIVETVSGVNGLPERDKCAILATFKEICQANATTYLAHKMRFVAYHKPLGDTSYEPRRGPFRSQGARSRCLRSRCPRNTLPLLQFENRAASDSIYTMIVTD